jgi:hypothetical protein
MSPIYPQQRFLKKAPRAVGGIGGVVLFLLTVVPGAAQIKEMPAKARFLEAAIRFISWPADSNKDTATAGRHTFTIGTTDDDRFVTALTETFTRKSPQSAPVRIIRINKLRNVDSCDLVYISGSRAPVLDGILAVVRGKPILTVTDFPDFTSRGVILAITIENQHIRCYINQSEADKAHLGISYHLLQKSTIVRTRGPRP